MVQIKHQLLDGSDVFEIVFSVFISAIDSLIAAILEFATEVDPSLRNKTFLTVFM